MLKSCSGLNGYDVARRKIILCRLNGGRIVSIFLLRPGKSLKHAMREDIFLVVVEISSRNLKMDERLYSESKMETIFCCFTFDMVNVD